MCIHVYLCICIYRYKYTLRQNYRAVFSLPACGHSQRFSQEYGTWGSQQKRGYQQEHTISSLILSRICICICIYIYTCIVGNGHCSWQIMASLVLDVNTNSFKTYLRWLIDNRSTRYAMETAQCWIGRSSKGSINRLIAVVSQVLTSRLGFQKCLYSCATVWPYGSLNYIPSFMIWLWVKSLEYQCIHNPFLQCTVVWRNSNLYASYRNHHFPIQMAIVVVSSVFVQAHIILLVI